VVHGDKELTEKLGRNDPCPCGSARLFQALLPGLGLLLMAAGAMIISVDDIQAHSMGRRIAWQCGACNGAAASSVSSALPQKPRPSS
jgi:hypothetical protein